MNKPVRIKRIYKTVSVEHNSTIMLDGRSAKTQGRNPLTAPTKELADAVAKEWALQREYVDRQSMPLTALLSLAIDSDEAGKEDWRDEILKYLSTDLICYRAEKPDALVEKQTTAWDPYMNWLREEFNGTLIVTSGVSAVTQPAAAAVSIRSALSVATAHTLIAIDTATKITGSAVLALALWKRFKPAQQIFNAARLDERFQEEKWGVDAEAKVRERSLEKEFLAAADFIRLIEGE